MRIDASDMASDVGKSDAGKTLAGRLAIAGGGLLVLGALLPWITVFIPGSGETPSNSGMEGEDGLIFLMGGLVIAALGLWAFSGRPSAVPALLIVGGLAAGIGAFLEYSDIAQQISSVSDSMGSRFSYSVGEGIWLLFAGALLTVVAGFVLWRQMEPVAEPGAARARRRQQIGVAGVALVVLLLGVMSFANANNGDWWSRDGFTWCPNPEAFCEYGLEIHAT